MLKKVIITNYLGETAEYKIEGVQSDDESGLFITSVDGLGPVKATINMMDLATTDGQLYNSARLSGRNIVIKALFTEATSIEEARLLSYKYFPIKSKVNIKIVTDKRTAETNGYVESNEPDIFSEREGCQISILCENPYFNGGEVSYIFNDTIPEFSFPFGNESLTENLIELSRNSYIEDEREFFYEGDADSGMEIEVSVLGGVMDSFSVSGIIEIDGENDQKIKIDTNKFSKNVPNTMSSKYVKSGFFTLDDSSVNIQFTIPGDEQTSTNWNYKSVMCGDDIHFFNCNFWHVTHYKTKTFSLREYEELPPTGERLSFYNYIRHLFYCNDLIYAYAQGSGNDGMYRFDLTTNEWLFICSLPDYMNPASVYNTKGVVYNNKIHMFSTIVKEYGSDIPTEAKSYHATFDGNEWELVENLTQEYPNLFPTQDERPGVMYYSFENAKVLVKDDKIHIFGGAVLPTNKNHYIWENGEWIDDVESRPPTAVNFSRSTISMVVYKNQFHLFEYSNYAETHRYIFNDNRNIWEQVDSLPFGYLGEPLSDSNYIYLVSSDEKYSQHSVSVPNDKCIVEFDRLVINTNKGKKSVILYRDDKQYNVINALEKGSKWLQIHRGTNKISYDAENGSEHMQVKLTTNKWYEGV